MDSDVILGIDLGTSAVKVLAVTAQGDVLGRGTGSYPIHRIREGWAEQDPEKWWDATVGAVRDALAQTRAATGKDRVRVAGVGFSGQVNGIVALDHAGAVMRPAIIWLDQRAGDEADYINHVAGDVLVRTALGRASPIHSASKLVWMLRHEADRISAARQILAPKDFLAYRMTGEMTTDVTDAGASLLLDLPRREWANELLDRLRIPRRLLPRVVESPTVVGRIRPEIALATGIPEGTPVVIGAGDMAAITVGTGVIEPGLGCIMIGTAGQIALYMEGQPRAAPAGVWAMTAPIPGGYFWHGLVMTAGYCLSWLGDVFSAHNGDPGGRREFSDIGELTKAAETSTAGSRGLVFLPFLDGAASPHADAQARGAFLGATSTHRRGDFVRAVMEGVAYNFREAFETFAELGQVTRRIRVGGGGSRSVLWQGILADVLGTGLDLLAEHDASAFGAAVISAVGTGTHSGFTQACRTMVRIRGNVEPDEARQGLYREYYAVYQAFHPRVRELSHTLGELARRSGV